MNNLPTCTDSKTALYADDAVLICHEKSKHTLKAKTEKELKNVKSWVASNKLSLNFDKTHCMLYSNKSKHQQHDFVLDIDGKKLFPETSTKYFGIILDENLNWAEHLQYVSKKLSIAGGIMYRLQHYLTPKLLMQVYYSIAYPHLQYAITSWGKAPATYINKAQVQCNRLIRILSKTYKQKVKLSSLFRKLNILKIEDIYNLETLKFMCKFKNKTLPTPFRNYFTPASNFYNYSTRNSEKGNYYFSKVNKKLTQRSVKICGTKLRNKLPTRLLNYTNKGLSVFSKKIKITLLKNSEEK